MRPIVSLVVLLTSHVALAAPGLCNGLFSSRLHSAELEAVMPADALLRLNTVVRSAWLNLNIKQAETVWQHSKKLETATIALLTRRSPENVEKGRLLALVHDMAENRVPDFTPDDPITKQQKHDLEKAEFKRLRTQMAKGQDEHLYEVWLDYEFAGSPTAKLVKQLDKLDFAIQVMAYERAGVQMPEKDVWINNARRKITDPELITIFNVMQASRSVELEASVYEQYFALLATGLEN